MDRFSRIAAAVVLGGSRRLRGDSWGGGMGPQETEPSAGRPEVLERRLGSVGREGVKMVWRLGPGGGSGAALEAAKADARAMSHRLGTRGLPEFAVGKVAKDWVEVAGTMGWGPAGARMDLAEVKAVLEKERWT